MHSLSVGRAAGKKTLAAGDWKKKHQAKATAEQMELYEANKHLHAKHEPTEDHPPPRHPSQPPPPQPPPPPHPSPQFKDTPDLLAQANPATTQAAPAAQAPTPLPTSPPPPPPAPAGGGLSDVCCTPAGELVATTAAPFAATASANGSRGPVSVRLGVLTVSDRVTSGVYADESGSEIRRVMKAYASATGAFRIFSTLSYEVPDDAALISRRICEMSASGGDRGGLRLSL